MKKIVLIILWVPVVALMAQERELTRYVNTLQGTNSKFELTYGNTYPTTALPWGMNFWTPQTGPNRDGWIYQYFLDSIRGFRQTHQCSSWTRDYAAFSLMPVSGKLEVNQYRRSARFDHRDEIGRPHYYKVTFDNKVTAEMSPTERGVHFRFKFPKKESYVVLDANTGGSMVKIVPSERKITGYCKNANRSVPQDFANYFVVVFDQPFEEYGTWEGSEGALHPGETVLEKDYAGAYVKFANGATVQAKVASSFISIEQAELTLQQELGAYKRLEETKLAAQKAWNKALNKIQVEGGTEEQKATFYSCFFRSMLFPRKFYEHDAEGKPVYYSPYDGKIHDGVMFTDNGFWDTFRAQFPLNALLHPAFHEKYIVSLLDAYDQSGWLPSWSFPGHQGGMIGNHAASLLADAWAKGFRSFDPKHALEAIIHEATSKGPGGPANGRDGWKDYFLLGYVPYPDVRESTAKTLEYCYNDWCAMQLASQAGLDFYAGVFRKQIFNYRNVYDPSTRFMRGRGKDGAWTPGFDPIEWGGPFTEGSAWHYHWSVFHDIQGLINLMGGDANFIAKLDSVFTVPNDFKVGTYRRVIHEMTEMALANMGQYAHGNQPIQHAVYLYNYAGEPWKSQKWARTVMDKLYNSGPNGYPGDEDQGQTSSWFVLSAMGLYSVCPGTDEYVIGSPLFPKMTISLENGKTLVIEAAGNSGENVYIRSAELNGKPFTRNYLRFGELTGGGTLRYRMDDQPAYERGIAKADRPYSVSVEYGSADAFKDVGQYWMYWPEKQAFPTFATPADTLDAIRVEYRNNASEESVMFSALQGLVNREKPSVILLRQGGEESMRWPQLLNLKLREFAPENKWELVRKYRDKVNGVILYSIEKSQHYRNLATTAAGLRNALPVTKAEYESLIANNLNFKVLEDLTGLSYTEPQDIYRHLHRVYWKDCTKRLLVHHRAVPYIRDIAVAAGAATVWLDPRNVAERNVLRLFLQDMKAGESIILGWWAEERSGIGIGTEHGISTVPADYYENATVYAGMSHVINMPPIPKKPELENKVYLALFLSDGDNIQYCQNALLRLWQNPQRGIIPINWTISPSLADLGPGLLNYFYSTATPNDFFASGPSGLGYSLLYDAHNRKWNNTGGQAFDEYLKLTQRYLEKSGLRVITVWDEINQGQMESYATYCRYLYGATQQDWERQIGKIPSYAKQNKLAFLPNYPCYANGPDVFVRMNRDTIAKFDGSRPVFLTAQGESWRMGPESMVTLLARLDSISPGNIVICRGDHFFALYNEANDMDFNLTLSSKMTITSSPSSTPAGYAADGTCTAANTWVSSEKGAKWLQFDFSATYLMSRYVIRHAGAVNGMDEALMAKSFTIETSEDGKKWMKADSQDGNQADVTDRDIAPVKARFFRVMVSENHAVGIADVEIYGSIL